MRDLEKELEQEYERFIEFGGLLDKRMRTYLVQYLRNKFQPDRYLIPELQEQYYEYFREALDQIFLIDGLLKLTAYNQKLKKQVIQDVLYWLRKAHKKATTKNPYQDEKDRLEGWAVTPLHVFIKRWSALPNYLATVYERTNLDYRFFQDKFNKLIRASELDQIPEQDQLQIERLFKDVLAQWDALLYAKILAFKLEKFEEEQEGFLEFMSKKVSEYNKIRAFLNPFTDYLGWDLSRKLWQETSFDVLYHYDDL
ncbi:MAG: hypothetical protein AAFY91_09715, partial [Bacteroidota bacterium]